MTFPFTKPTEPVAVASRSSRMTLANVQRGRIDLPYRVVCVGVEGVGKSTFAAGAPDPVFLTSDAGSGQLDIARLPEPQNWQDVLDAIRALQTETHDYKTFVVDSVTWLEPMLHRKVCADAKWSDIEEPGYGKGYTAAVSEWRVFISELERLWFARRMNIVIISHCMVKSFKNPDGEDFERYQLSLNDKAAGVIRQWVDAVLFAKHEVFAKKEGKRVRGYSTGARVLHTQWSAAYDAKNRYGLPEELPLSWQAFDEAARACGPARANELRKQISTMVAELGDEVVAAKVRGYVALAKDDVSALAEVANAVAMKLDVAKSANTTGENK